MRAVYNIVPCGGHYQFFKLFTAFFTFKFKKWHIFNPYTIKKLNIYF